MNECKIPFLFARAGSFQEQAALVSENGSLYGLVDTSGHWIIPPDYPYLSQKTQNRVVYREKKLCGIMDGKGNRITQPAYNAIAPFSEGMSLVSRFVNLREQWGFIDTSGMVVIPLFDYLKKSPSREFSLISFESYVRGINSFYSGFTAVETKIYEGKKLKEINIEYYMDRAGRRYADKRFW